MAENLLTENNLWQKCQQEKQRRTQLDESWACRIVFVISGNRCWDNTWESLQDNMEVSFFYVSFSVQ